MSMVHVPAFVESNDMLVSLSLITRTYCDQHLLNIAKMLDEPLMNEGGWHEKLIYTEANHAAET